MKITCFDENFLKKSLMWTFFDNNLFWQQFFFCENFSKENFFDENVYDDNFLHKKFCDEYFFDDNFLETIFSIKTFWKKTFLKLTFKENFIGNKFFGVNFFGNNFFDDNYLAHVIEKPNLRIPNPQYFLLFKWKFADFFIHFEIDRGDKKTKCIHKLNVIKKIVVNIGVSEFVNLVFRWREQDIWLQKNSFITLQIH